MKIKPLQKFTRIFAGLLASVFVVTVFLKLFTSFVLAAIGGLLVNSLAAYLILKKSRTSTEGEALKYLAYGAMLGTAIVVIGSLVLWLMVESAFSGIAD